MVIATNALATTNRTELDKQVLVCELNCELKRAEVGCALFDHCANVHTVIFFTT